MARWRAWIDCERWLNMPPIASTFSTARLALIPRCLLRQRAVWLPIVLQSKNNRCSSDASSEL
jgi:hypothetical protein